MGRRRYRYDTYAPDVTYVQQPPTFSPPIAMRQSVWDSIVNGNFVDAKIFAFSRRSREPGRVDTPKTLFVNTHVLAAACSYFRSVFDFPDGILTSLKAGVPLGVEPFFDMGEHDPDDDYDAPVEDSIERDPAKTQLPTDATVIVLPERAVKAYVVKYTAYRTMRAIIWYIYSGEIKFSPSDSAESPSASAKSIYRFADEHGMGDLKKLAFEKIAASVSAATPSQLVEEAFSVFTSRYPEIRDLYIKRLRPELSSFSGPKDAFQQQLSRYFSGEIPHSRDILTSLLQALMDGSTTSDLRFEPGSGCDTIPRVPRPWPDRTKRALRTSLDEGIFEDFRLAIPLNSVSSEHLVHFAGAVDEGVGSLISSVCRSEPTYRHEAEVSLSTWRAVMYYVYTNCISSKQLGPENTEPVLAYSPSDMQFQGYLCPPREVLCLAHKLTTCDTLVNLMTTEIISHMTPKNVVEEMFYDPPSPARVIGRGVEIIQENRSNIQIRSQLQKVLEGAASGGSSVNLAAFSACFSVLFGEPRSSVFGKWGFL